MMSAPSLLNDIISRSRSVCASDLALHFDRKTRDEDTWHARIINHHIVIFVCYSLADETVMIAQEFRSFRRRPFVVHT